MTPFTHRRSCLVIVIAAMVAVSCSATPSESPWATDPDVPDLPSPTLDLENPPGEAGTDGSGTGPIVRLIDDECVVGEVRCGLAAVPQVDGSSDQVTLEFRVLSDRGAGTPVVHLLEGGADLALGPDDLPDRPLVEVGGRGIHPGEPNLSCPEFYDAETNEELGELVAACVDRLALAGIDTAGTLPSQAGVDVGLTLRALGFDEVDLIVPSWRALSAASIADHVRVRRIVYTNPWFATDRSIGAAMSAAVSIEAVWDHCRSLESCTLAGTVDDFLGAVAALDARPLDDVHDTFSDEPRPLDTARVAGAIVSNTTRSIDIAFLPQLHRAIIDRDAETVSSFVQDASAGSAEVNLLGVTCSLFDHATATAAALPSPLREDAADGIDLFANACPAWPTEAVTTATPLPGLTLLTQSNPTDGADFARAAEAGPVIVEPTVGPPTPACVIAAAAAWFDRNEADASGCDTPLAIGDREQPISQTLGVYDAGDVTVELAVPDTWTDSGYGIWWRDADPLDTTNLDVYVWEAVDAEATRSQVAADWGLVEPELTSTQVGERIWLLATGAVGIDTVYQIATSRIDGRNIAVILESESGEATRLTTDVLIPALDAVAVG